MKINEIKMGYRGLAKKAARAQALVGIEFEMLLPREDSTVQANFNRNQRVTSIPEVIDFFNVRIDGGLRANSWYQLNKLEEKLEQRLDKWSRERVELYQSSIPEEEKEQEVQRLKNDSQQEFLRDENLEYTKNVFDEYEEIISWPYNNPASTISDQELEEATEDFIKLTGYKNTVSYNGHGGPRPPGTFVFERDSTIKANLANLDPDDYIDAEIVSYPMPLEQAEATIKTVSAYARHKRARFNNNCGLHINVSVPNFQNLDFLKLAVLLGDEYIADLFNRGDGQNYSTSIIAYIRGVLRTGRRLRDPNTILSLADDVRAGDMKKVQNALRLYERFSVAFRENRIELRSPGGHWADKENSLIRTIHRLIVAVQAAVDPQAYRQEYLTKIYKLMKWNSFDTPQDQNEDMAHLLKQLEKYRLNLITREELANYLKAYTAFEKPKLPK